MAGEPDIYSEQQALRRMGWNDRQIEAEIRRRAVEGRYGESAGRLFPEMGQQVQTPSVEQYAMAQAQKKVAPLFGQQIQRTGVTPQAQPIQQFQQPIDSYGTPMRPTGITQIQAPQLGGSTASRFIDIPTSDPFYQTADPYARELEAYLRKIGTEQQRQLGRGKEEMLGYLEKSGLSTGGIGGQLMERTISDIQRPYTEAIAGQLAEYGTRASERRLREAMALREESLTREREQARLGLDYARLGAEQQMRGQETLSRAYGQELGGVSGLGRGYTTSQALGYPTFVGAGAKGTGDLEEFERYLRQQKALPQPQFQPQGRQRQPIQPRRTQRPEYTSEGYKAVGYPYLA